VHGHLKKDLHIFKNFLTDHFPTEYRKGGRGGISAYGGVSVGDVTDNADHKKGGAGGGGVGVGVSFFCAVSCP